MSKCPYLCIVRYHFKASERYLRNSHLTMKKLLFTLSLVGLITLTACGLQRGINDLSLGMSKRQTFTKDMIAYVRDAARYQRFSSLQVKRILQLFSWDSERLDVLRILAPSMTDGYKVHEIIETFDFSSGRDEARRILRTAQQTEPIIIQTPEWSQYDRRAQEEAEQEFKEFLARVKRQTFTKDMIAYVRDAARYQRFSSLQVKRILQLFSWDSERLDVLRILAPTMMDGYKVHEIIDVFDFSSGKDEARRILGITR